MDIEKLKSGLYLCATPIGNLEDMTFRVARILKEADLIAAEDTRNSLKLLNHLDIHTPMTSYHEYNKYDKAEELIAAMKKGKSVALVTDAGMPAISDPGEVLVKRCHEEGIYVTVIPGATACVSALALSGMPSRRFCFEGFLEHDKKERTQRIEALKKEERTIILYEAPHHLKKTLKELAQALGEDREMTLCRELTKKHEEAFLSTIGETIARYEQEEPRGECVLIIKGIDSEKLKQEKKESFEEMTLEEHMELYTSQGIDRKEAMKRVAKDRGISKRDVYKDLLETEEDK